MLLGAERGESNSGTIRRRVQATANLRCKVRRLIPMNSAALVRFPLALIKAVRSKRFSFSSLLKLEPEGCGTAETHVDSTSAGAENLESRSYGVTFLPRFRTTVFSQKPRSSRIFPGHHSDAKPEPSLPSIQQGAAIFSTEVLNEVIKQHREVFLPLTQRWKVDHHDIQSVEQIFAKLSSFRHFSKVAVRRANEPHVDVHGLRTAGAQMIVSQGNVAV